MYLDVLQTRLDGRAGFHSKMATKRLLKRLNEIKPDIVHLHNLHGYYVNVEMLFNWLAEHNCKVKWTLHDCWAFTGHCAHFSFVNCAQWKTMCSGEERCPQLSMYPKTYSKRSTSRNYTEKKDIFTCLNVRKLTIITPSEWLKNLVKYSFLSKYDIEVHHNEIDRSVFRPVESNFRAACGIDERIMILGVASAWSERKGLWDFLGLARCLNSQKYAIVLVGLTNEQAHSIAKKIKNAESVCDATQTGIKAEEKIQVQNEFSPDLIDQIGMVDDTGLTKMTDNFELDTHVLTLGGTLIVLIGKTESRSQLASIYSAADIFFNPTYEDTFPTVNLEAEACGTRVITYDTGGCAETISRNDSKVIDSNVKRMIQKRAF